MNKSHWLKFVLLLVLAVVAVVVVYRAFAGSRGIGDDDPAIRVAMEWIQAAERDDSDRMRQLMTGSEAQKVIDGFLAEQKIMGSSRKCELRQKSRRVSEQLGTLYEIDFSERLERIKRQVLLKVYVVEEADKKMKVAAARYFMGLPLPWKDGLPQPAVFSTDSPEVVAQKWFDFFDQGKTAVCSQAAVIRRSFESGRMLEAPTNLAVNPNFQSWLDKNRSPVPPVKRDLTGVQLWQELPGFYQVEIVAVNYHAVYPKKSRNERIWLLRDNYFRKGVWMPYGVNFSKWVDTAAAKTKKTEDKKKS